MQRYLSGKRMKSTANAMFVNVAVILLAIAGYGECAGELSEEDAAMTIDLQVYQKIGLQKQFAFLYLHDNEGNVYFDNTEVSNKLTGPKYPETEVPSTWPFPSAVKDSNFLLTVPDKFIPNRKQYGEHAEHKLLLVLKSMMDGYRSRYGHCPKHIILGSKYLPCLETSNLINVGNRPKHACALEYGEMKNQLKSECTETTFYLYVRCPERTHPENYREEIINLIQQGAIKTLFPPYTSSHSDFYQIYCSDN